MPNDALIGATGFVGGTLRRAREFAGEFNSATVGELPEHEWDEVVCAAMPAEKWRANQDPDGDAAALERLWEPLARARFRRLVLISTVDVYERPAGHDESSPPDASHPYGRNRAELERRARDAFASVAIVRLPALYGPGLKKNALYDLLDGRACPISPEASFQWYEVERLPADLQTVASEGIELVQLVSEPVTMAALIERCFPEAELDGAGPAPQYELRTLHAGAFGGRDGFIRDRESSLAGIERFVGRVRAGEVACASPSR